MSLLYLSLRQNLSVRGKSALGLRGNLNRSSYPCRRMSYSPSPPSPATFSSQLSASVDGIINNNKETSDLLVTGLNGAQDISIKVVSCREVVQECILRNDISPQGAKFLAEVLTCSMMMGAGLKGDETLQVNFVGSKGIKSAVAITDGDLKARGMVGNTRFSVGGGVDVKTSDLLGEGQIQVVRNHPSWKQPMNGIVALRDAKVALNLALYMAESEQRSSVLLTDVRVDGNLCRHALGIMVERLPGASDANIETSIVNLEGVERKGLRAYLDRTDEERSQDNAMFRSMEGPLNSILDDCLGAMSADSIRWDKTPRFRCSCGIDKVWRTLRLLPREEVASLVSDPKDVEIKCEFCGETYLIDKAQIEERILSEPK